LAPTSAHGEGSGEYPLVGAEGEAGLVGDAERAGSGDPMVVPQVPQKRSPGRTVLRQFGQFEVAVVIERVRQTASDAWLLDSEIGSPGA
jgi:hypothetical protein